MGKMAAKIGVCAYKCAILNTDWDSKPEFPQIDMNDADLWNISVTDK